MSPERLETLGRLYRKAYCEASGIVYVPSDWSTLSENQRNSWKKAAELFMKWQ